MYLSQFLHKPNKYDTKWLFIDQVYQPIKKLVYYKSKQTSTTEVHIDPRLFYMSYVGNIIDFKPTDTI